MLNSSSLINRPPSARKSEEDLLSIIRAVPCELTQTASGCVSRAVRAPEQRVAVDGDSLGASPLGVLRLMEPAQRQGGVRVLWPRNRSEEPRIW